MSIFGRIARTVFAGLLGVLALAACKKSNSETNGTFQSESSLSLEPVQMLTRSGIQTDTTIIGSYLRRNLGAIGWPNSFNLAGGQEAYAHQLTLVLDGSTATITTDGTQVAHLERQSEDGNSIGLVTRDSVEIFPDNSPCAVLARNLAEEQTDSVWYDASIFAGGRFARLRPRVSIDRSGDELLLPLTNLFVKSANSGCFSLESGQRFHPNTSLYLQMRQGDTLVVQLKHQVLHRQ